MPEAGTVLLELALPDWRSTSDENGEAARESGDTLAFGAGDGDTEPSIEPKFSDRRVLPRRPLASPSTGMRSVGFESDLDPSGFSSFSSSSLRFCAANKSSQSSNDERHLRICWTSLSMMTHMLNGSSSVRLPVCIMGMNHPFIDISLQQANEMMDSVRARFVVVWLAKNLRNSSLISFLRAQL